MKITGIAPSWIESVKILIPKNLKLFILASLNAVKHALIPAALFSIAYAVLFFLFQMYVRAPRALALSVYISYSLMLFGFIGLIWVIRPSVNKKDNRYFFSGIAKMIIAALTCALLFLAVSETSQTLLLRLFPGSDSKGIFILVSIGFLLFTCVYSLFLFDQKLSIKNVVLSLYRSILFVFYNLPFIILLYGFSIGCINLLIYLFTTISSLFVTVQNTFGIPYILIGIADYIVILFIVSMLSVFYTKRVHEQYELYF